MNSSSIFSGNLDGNIMDFMNDEEEHLITFEKDTVEDAHIAASEDILLFTLQPPLTSVSWKLLLIKNMTNM